MVLANPSTIELDDCLGNWQYLPYRNQLQDPKSCIALYRSYIDGLVKAGASAKTSLVWASAQSEAGTWLAGVRVLDWDSNLFEFPIGRLEPLIAPDFDSLHPPVISAGVDLIERCLDNARQLDLKLISAAVDSRDSASQMCLQRCGFRLMDTIVVYRADVCTDSAKVTGSHTIRSAGLEDIEQLAAISAQCFGDRQFSINRFNCEPLFPNTKVRQLYADWLRNMFEYKSADQIFVAEVQGEVSGFIGLKLPAPAELSNGLNLGRVPLNAVHPKFHNRGIYTELVRKSLAWFRQNGVKYAQIGTQLSGLAVPHVWQKFGACLDSSYHTFHLSFD